MIYLAVILFTIFLDQYSKYLVLRYLKPIDTYPLIENVFHLTYVENRGAAFSLFTNMQPFLIFITMIFAGVLIYILIKTPKKRANLWVNLSVSCIIGGAIGNLIDRIRLNYVIEFWISALLSSPFLTLPMFLWSAAAFPSCWHYLPIAIS